MYVCMYVGLPGAHRDPHPQALGPEPVRLGRRGGRKRAHLTESH